MYPRDPEACEQALISAVKMAASPGTLQHFHCKGSCPLTGQDSPIARLVENTTRLNDAGLLCSHCDEACKCTNGDHNRC